jgi:hypothetical protein
VTLGCIILRTTFLSKEMRFRPFSLASLKINAVTALNVANVLVSDSVINNVIQGSHTSEYMHQNCAFTSILFK